MYVSGLYLYAAPIEVVYSFSNERIKSETKLLPLPHNVHDENFVVDHLVWSRREFNPSCPNPSSSNVVILGGLIACQPVSIRYHQSQKVYKAFIILRHQCNG
jgi:hypothetical protein